MFLPKQVEMSNFCRGPHKHHLYTVTNHLDL